MEKGNIFSSEKSREHCCSSLFCECERMMYIGGLFVINYNKNICVPGVGIGSGITFVNSSNL